MDVRDASVRCPRLTIVPAVTILLAVGVVGCVTFVPPSPVPADGALDRASVVPELIAAHNRIRAARHLAPLKPSAPLEAAAQAHAQDMARRHWMSHRGGDFSSPFGRMAARGYRFRRAGENVAAGYRSVDAVMKGWMHSPGHRWNILGRFTEMGAACAIASNGTPYWCVTFGDPGVPE